MSKFNILQLKQSTSNIINKSFHQYLNNKKKINFHHVELFFLQIYQDIIRSHFYRFLHKTPLFQQTKYILQKMNYSIYTDYSYDELNFKKGIWFCDIHTDLHDNFDSLIKKNIEQKKVITISEIFNQLYLFYQIDKNLHYKVLKNKIDNQTQSSFSFF